MGTIKQHSDGRVSISLPEEDGRPRIECDDLYTLEAFLNRYELGEYLSDTPQGGTYANFEAQTRREH